MSGFSNVCFKGLYSRDINKEDDSKEIKKIGSLIRGTSDGCIVRQRHYTIAPWLGIDHARLIQSQ